MTVPVSFIETEVHLLVPVADIEFQVEPELVESHNDPVLERPVLVSDARITDPSFEVAIEV